MMPRKTTARDLLRHVAAGLVAASVVGGATGLALTLRAATLELSDLLFGGEGPWAILAAFLGATLSLLLIAILSPIVLIIGGLGNRIPWIGALRPAWTYSFVCIAALLFLHGAFVVVFNVVRDASSPRGLVLLGSLFLVCGLGAVSLSILMRRRAPFEDGPPARRDLLALPGLAALALISWGSFSWLGSESATAVRVVLTSPLVKSTSDLARAPDVILISIDTLRADHLSCSGYDRSTTPNLDWLAAGGGALSQDAQQRALDAALARFDDDGPLPLDPRRALLLQLQLSAHGHLCAPG